MTIELACRCGQRLMVPTGSAGTVACPACGETLDVRSTPTLGPGPFTSISSIVEDIEEAQGRSVRVSLGAPGGAPTGGGRSLGHHEIIESIGRGGMGEILLVHDPGLNRRLAAKTILGGPTDAYRIEKFLLEAQITGQLEHPNIVPIHELGLSADGRLYFTMKRVEGRNLGAILASTDDHSLVGLLGLFTKVCDGVAYAHSRHVIHRDLKPENIMVGRFGEVLVMDWGLAKVLTGPAGGPPSDVLDRPIERGPATRDSEPVLTLDGMVVGTPAYMAPEQARGEIGNLDRRTDVYSLGAILYEILTLVPPYEGTDARAVIDQVLDREPLAPGERAPDREIPRELEAVVVKAMGRTRRERYASVEDLRADVERFLEGRTLAVVEYSTAERLAKWVRRNRAVVGPLAVAAALLIGSSISFVHGTLVSNRQLEAQTAALEIERQKADGAAAEAREQNARYQQALARSLVEASRAAWESGYSSEAWAYAAASLEQADDPRTRLLLGRARAHSRARLEIFEPLADPPPDAPAAIDPGGRFVATVDGRTVLLRDLRTGRVRRLASDREATIVSVLFDGDGSLLAIGDSDGRIDLRDVATGEVHRQLGGERGRLEVMVFCPDGETLVASWGSSELTFWNFRTDVVVEPWFEPSSGRGHVTAVAFGPGDSILALARSTGGDDHEIEIYSRSAGQRIHSLHGHEATIRRLAFAGEAILVSGADDHRIVVWDLRRRQPLEVLEDHGDAITALAVAPGAGFLVTASRDGAVKLRRLPSGGRREALGRHDPPVVALAIRPSEGSIVCVARDSGATVWDAGYAHSRSVRLEPPGRPVTGLALDPEGRRVAATTIEGPLEIWEAGTGSRLQPLAGSESSSLDVDFAPDGRRLVSAARTLDLWDVDHATKLWSLEPAGPFLFTAVRFEPGGERLAIGTSRASIALVDARTGEIVRQLGKTRFPIRALAFDDTGRRLFSLGYGEILLHDLAGDAPPRVLARSATPLTAMAVDPRNDRLAYCPEGGRVEVVDIGSLEGISTLAADDGRVRAIAFSPDGRLVATGGDDWHVRLWEAATGRLLIAQRHHDGPLSSLAFAPAGDRLVTAGADGEVVVWDLSVLAEPVERLSEEALRETGWRVEQGELVPTEH